MIFEPQAQDRGNLRVFQYDYGTPVIFLAGQDQGFQIGEQIAFVFQTDAITDKVFTVDAEDYSLSLKLEKSEADALYNGDVPEYIRIPFSAKRYSASGEFLETVLNGYLIVMETVEWQS